MSMKRSPRQSPREFTRRRQEKSVNRTTGEISDALIVEDVADINSELGNKLSEITASMAVLHRMGTEVDDILWGQGAGTMD